MNSSSPNCVREMMFGFVDGMIASPPAEVSDDESLHHQLVDRWFRDRFFLPRAYRSTSLNVSDENTENDIVDEISNGNSMALFPESLISQEIRSCLTQVSDDEDSCSLRYRCSNHNFLCGSKAKMKHGSPPGIVTITDGAPSIPSDRSENTEERLEAESHDDEPCSPQYSLGSICRTFSFDDQIPVIHSQKSSKRLMPRPTQDNDMYIDQQISFTSPVSCSNDGNRNRIVYSVPIH